MLYVATYKKDLKNSHNSSDKHESLSKGTSARKNLINNKKKIKILSNPLVKKNKKFRVLLGESNSGVRAMIELYLESLNLDYITADSGDKALRFFSSSTKIGKKNYDVVLLDSHLDGISGLEVAFEIHKQSPHQRIMIMSASPREYLSDELIKSAKIHESDIFARPFRLAELICSIEPIP
jgi:CheY-like chemotaxis protein